MQRTHAGVAPSVTTMREIVGFATRAPSVHNTQPWRWRSRGDRLELRADRARQLRQTDPEGRNLAISCGAAIEHAVAYAASVGWAADVDLLPSTADPDHLATLRFRPGAPGSTASDAVGLLSARRTDRRRFTAWPLPDPLVRRLAATAVDGAVCAVPVGGNTERVRVELLVTRALWTQGADADLVAEQAVWAAPSDASGIPETSRPTIGGRASGRPSRFDDPGRAAAARVDVASTDGLLVLAAADDSPQSWLTTGRVLCRVWVEAMAADLSVVPLSAVVEVAETREALRREVLGGDGHPMLLLRIGWQEVARTALPPTPRRSVDDVLTS